MTRYLFGVMVLTVICGVCSDAGAGSALKVYILAGQSNMQGHAQVRTFDHMALDPKTVPILEEMRAADGTLRVCDQVWISTFNAPGEGGQSHGKLTTGYGARRDITEAGEKIGPEFTFGIYMEKLLEEPILIIKTAWGGKSLHTDFRPPSGGPYEFNQHQLDLYEDRGTDMAAVRAEKIAATGHYYGLMMGHIKDVLSDVERVCPAYDSEEGYELAGFVWFQGWNDMVDGDVYPDRKDPGGYDLYSALMADFIRDVRKGLSAPKMPFVIGVMGVGGVLGVGAVKSTPDYFREAMAAPVGLPEFRGNVAAVLTERYWDAELGELSARWDKVRSKSRGLNKDESLSVEERTAALDAYTATLYTKAEMELYRNGSSNAGYHYLGSAKIMAQIGKGFAEAMAGLASDN